MKNILLFTIFSLCSIGLIAQAPTSYSVTDDSTNDTEFTAAIAFDADGAGDVILDNSTYSFFVHKDYTGATLTDIQGGAWAVSNNLTNDQLEGVCGAAAAADYRMIVISTNGQANLGAVVTDVKEDLVKVHLDGPGDASSLVLPFDPAGGDALSQCIAAAGINNTADIDLDGNGGDPGVAYEDIPGGASITLPIELRTFDVVRKNSAAALTWTTSSEINSSHFEIEKSTNAHDWASIGKVTAKGFAHTSSEYRFLDDSFTSVSDGVFYYRLRMVDMDGKYEYSGVRSVIFAYAKSPYSFKLYPNPSSDFIQVGIDNSDIEVADLKIYDVEGRLVISQLINSTSENTISLESLNSGSYNAVIKAGNQTMNKKFVVQK